MSKFQYTLQPDIETAEDYNLDMLKTKLGAPIKLPKAVSLRDRYTKLFNQKNIGKCQSCAMCLGMTKEGYNPSPIFEYFNIRELTGQIHEDVGGTLKDTCWVTSKIGISDIEFWADDNSKWDIKPCEKAYENALLHKDVSYYRVKTIKEIKEALYLAKTTDKRIFVIIGIKIYESFESDSCLTTGIVPIPKIDEQILGGHALLVDSYDEIDMNFKYLEVANSWGDKNIGDNGFFKIPYNVIESSLMDAWVITDLGDIVTE